MSVQISQAVADALKGLEVARENEVAIEKTKEMNRKEADAHLKKLRKLLKSGETTGDPLRDLIIQVHGFSEKAEAMYRPLDDALKGMKGQFVFLAYSKKVDVMRGGPGDHKWHDIDLYRIAVLEDDSLILKGEEIIIPTSQYLGGTTSLYSAVLVADQLPGKVEGHILECGLGDVANQTDLITLLTNGRREEDWKANGVELIIGDKALEEWLYQHRVPLSPESLAKALSKPALELTEA